MEEGKMRSQTALGVFVLMLGLAVPALAVDGVREISQTCAVNTGCFSGDTAGFPVTIVASGSFRLTSDLSVDVPTTLIDIAASDVTVDLNGFHIRGTGGGGGDGVSSIASNVTVRDGSVGPVGAVGVNLTGSRARVEGVRVSGAFSGGIATGFNSLVTGCSVSQSSFGPGIETDSGSRVIANVATGNDANGISVSDSTLVEGNTVTGNAGRGIHAGARSIVKGNVSASSGSTGIRVSSSSLVKDNVVSDGATSGIFALGFGTIVGNTVTNNGGHGINVAADTLIRDNTVTRNTLTGIRADRGALVVGNLVNENNLADSSTEGGIKARGPSVVRDNIVRLNNQVGIFAETDPFDGMRGSVIEGNLATATLYCFDFEGTQNFYAGNRAYNCELNYRNVAGQIDGGGNLGN
jgi:hypothetical protein